MKKASSLISFTTALGLSFAIGWGSAASAQQQLPDEKVQSFVTAAMEVQKITESAQQELQAAQSPEQQQQIQGQAVERMTDAIEAEGLSVEEYNEIVVAAQNDPAVAAQIEQHLQQGQ